MYISIVFILLYQHTHCCALLLLLLLLALLCAFKRSEYKIARRSNLLPCFCSQARFNTSRSCNPESESIFFVLVNSR
jgi:hypothetical protein